MKTYRQGDVLLIEVDPQDVKHVATTGAVAKRDNGRVILAYGEVTGHAHAILEEDVVLKELSNVRIIEAPNDFDLFHEEHATIPVPAGTYKVVIQTEYSPSEFRTVID